MIRWLPAFLIAAIALAYANSFQGVFLFDDFSSIVRNESIASLRPAAIYSTYGPTRPVVAFSIAANYAMGGLNPLGYHSVNLCIHITAALLLFGIVRRILAKRGWFSDMEAARIAFVAALFFGVHPLQTSAVTYITQRMESMTAMFCLAMLYALVRTADSSRHRARLNRLWAAISVLAFSLAIFSKEIAITAPLVALLLDRVYLARTWINVWRRRRWLYVAYAIPLVAMLVTLSPKLHFLQVHYGDRLSLTAGTLDPENGHFMAHKNAEPQAFGNSDQGVLLSMIAAEAQSIEMPVIAAVIRPTLLEFVRSQPAVILHYFRLTVWPSGLCFDHQRQPEDSSLKIAWTSLVAVLTLGTSAYFVLRPGRSLLAAATAFPILTAWIMLSPRSSFQILDLAVEYRMYLPIAGLSALASTGIYIASRKWFSERHRTNVFSVISAVICLLLANQTITRNELYSSRLSMWSDVVAKSPQNARAKLNFATALRSAELHGEAMRQTQESVALLSEKTVQQLDPARAYRAFGDRLLQSGLDSQARHAYLVAFRLNPLMGKTLIGLAELAHRDGQPEQAEALYELSKQKKYKR